MKGAASIGGSVLLSLFLCPAPAFSGDFHLGMDGVGPIHISMKIQVRNATEELTAYPGKKAEVQLTALNDSGKPIRYARFCIQAMWRSKGCDFNLWTNQVWAPGEELTWNVRGNAPRGIENALVVLTKLRLAPPSEETTPPGPDLRLQSVRKIYIEHIDGNQGEKAREQLIALIMNSGWFVAVDDSKLADATINGRSELPVDPRPTTFSQVGIYGIVPPVGPAGKDSIGVENLVIRLNLPSGDILWAWDDSKRCYQTKAKCAVDDLSRQIAAW
jgi:hypothetical protein